MDAIENARAGDAKLRLLWENRIFDELRQRLNEKTLPPLAGSGRRSLMQTAKTITETLVPQRRPWEVSLTEIVARAEQAGVESAPDASSHQRIRLCSKPESMQAATQLARVQVVDDSANSAQSLANGLARDGYSSRVASTQGKALGAASGELEQTSPIMRELVESIALVARSNTPVLILGESGTGKERVARAIHASGPRANQPFVAVNTSAIPEQLLESELFGHVRGAFTGATQARRGLLAEANLGTLLLDEIGDMPITLQPKLLRVLQFGETRPVGSDRTGKVDVRVIAATHRDLAALVSDGRFREDLRYRLNVIPLVVPALRDRPEDIMPLAERFLQEARDRTLMSPVNSFSDEARNILTRAPWRGNVRELENAIERLVVLGRESVVTAADLSFLQEKPPGESWPAVEDAPWTLKQMNQRYLQWVLARTNGDKTRAAGILDIDLSTLYRWERAKR